MLKVNVSACFLLLVFSPWTASALIVSSIEIVCPIGGERFEAEAVMSGTSFGQNLDRRSYGATVSPWPLSKCPGNGFVIYKHDFSTAEINQLTPYVQSVAYQSLQASETNYYLAAHLMRRSGGSQIDIADALLKATWEVERDDRYNRYAIDALAAFEDVLADSSTELAVEEANAYRQIAGELERRLGRFAEASRRFQSLLEAPGVRGSDLESLVHQEIALIRARDAGTHAVKVVQASGQ